MTRRHAFLLLVPTLALVASCASGADESAGGGETGNGGGGNGGGEEVVLSDFEIDAPGSVEAGATLTVVNDGETTHNFIGDDDAFASDDLEPGDEGEVTFDEAGTFDFSCEFHPGQMTGSIEVTE